MRPITKALCLCLAVLLLFLSLTACRNRDFHPAIPPAGTPAEGQSTPASPFPADFRCSVYVADGDELRLDGEEAAALFEAAKRAYEKSESVDPFEEKPTALRLIFYTGGVAPEAVIPPYQLPNATLYGVYTVFPDDTGWYGDNLITAHVHSFRLKEGSFEALRALAGQS